MLLVVVQMYLSGTSQIQAPDSLNAMENSLSGPLADTVRLQRLVMLADFYMADKNTTKLGEAYVVNALEFADKKGLTAPWRLRWLHAMVLRSRDMVKQAEAEMEAVIGFLEQHNMPAKVAEARNYLAGIVFFSGRFNECLEMFGSNIRYAREHNLKSVIPKAYEGMANVYQQSKDTATYHHYLALSLESAESENNPGLAAQAYYRMGMAYMAAEYQPGKIIPYLTKALNIRKSMADSSAVLTTLNSIGWYYYTLHEPDSSLRYYLQAVDYCPPWNIAGFAKPYANIGTIYRDRKEYDKAMEYYQLSEEFGKKSHDYYVLAGLYKDMSDMFILQGDYKNAYEYQVAFKNANDSVNASRYLEGLAIARTRFSTEAKEQELQLLTLKLSQQKYLVYGISGMMILLIIIGLLLYRQSRLVARKRISEMNSRLSELTHANLRQQMNPHFIFNTLNSIQYYMYQHDKIATNNYLTKFSRLIRKILENSRKNLVSVRDEMDVIQLYLELETLRFKEKFTFEISIDDEIDTLTCMIPAMLIQPYVENAVCHGLINKTGHGRLTISLKLCDHYICCTIEDDGIGRAAAMEIKQQKETTHHSLGTQITESRINLTNSLYGTNLKVIYTDLNDDHDLPCGTRVEIQLPILT